MKFQNVNGFSVGIASPIAPSDLTVTLEPGAGALLPVLTPSNPMKMIYRNVGIQEVMEGTNVAGDVVTVSRAVEAIGGVQVAQTFPVIGTTVESSPTSDTMDQFLDKDADLSDLSSPTNALINLGITATVAELNQLSGTTVSGTNTGDQTVANTSDATSHTLTLSASGGSIKLVEGSNISLTTTGTASDGIVTIDSTSVDQTFSNASDATSHTVTLSASGGSIKFVEGSNISLTTTGTASDGVVIIASTGGGASSVGSIDSQPKSADGLVISGSVVYAQTADATFPGMVSISTQTFAGDKTFSGALLSPSTGTDSFKAGTSAVVGSSNAIAVGKNSSVDTRSTGSVVIGNGAYCKAITAGFTSDRAVVIGEGAYVDPPASQYGDHSVAIGYNAHVSHYFCTAVGSTVTASNQSAMAIGHSSTASGLSSIAIGTSCSATANYTRAIGEGVTCNAIYAIGLGTSISSTGQYAIGIGYSCSASGNDSIAIGDGTVANGLNSIAIGILANQSVTAGSDSIAIGNTARSQSSSSISVGKTSLIDSRSLRSISIGNGSSIQADVSFVSNDSIAIGSGSYVYKVGASCDLSTVIGANANSQSNSCVAIGESASSTGPSAITVGRLATASGNQSISIGFQSDATATGSIAIGSGVSVGAQATSARSIAIGGGAIASTATDCVALGDLAQAKAIYGVAIGPTASVGVGHTSSIALGRGVSTAAGQFIVGGDGGTCKDMYMGEGVSVSAPSDSSYNATGGSGTNIKGGNISINGGKSTGTGRGGSVLTQTSLSGSSGTAVNNLSVRSYQSAKHVDLTESTDTVFCNIALASSKSLGSELVCTVFANDGVDFQSITSRVSVNSVNKGGTITSVVSQVDSSLASSSGTLLVIYTAVQNGSSIDIRVNATSSLTQTLLRIRWSIVALNGDDIATVTPS